MLLEMICPFVVAISFSKFVVEVVIDADIVEEFLVAHPILVRH